jgi:hypothetical protein
VYAIYQGNKKKRKTEFEEFCPPPVVKSAQPAAALVLVY